MWKITPPPSAVAVSLGGFAVYSGDIVGEDGCVLVMGIMVLC